MPQVKWPQCGIDHSPSFSAQVTERVEPLCLHDKLWGKFYLLMDTEKIGYEDVHRIQKAQDLGLIYYQDLLNW